MTESRSFSSADQANRSASGSELASVNPRDEGSTGGDGAVNPSVNLAVNPVPADPQGFTYSGDLFTESQTAAPEIQREAAQDAPAAVVPDRDTVLKFLKTVYPDIPENRDDSGLIGLTAFTVTKRSVNRTVGRLGTWPEHNITHDHEWLADRVMSLVRGVAPTGEESPDHHPFVPVTGVFLRMPTLMGEWPTGNERGGQSNVRTLVGFVLDGDYDVAGHHERPKDDGKHPHPQSEEEVRDIWREAIGGEPTLVWNSGGGVNGFWALETPIQLTDDEDGARLLKQWREASQRFHDRVVHAANARGRHHDSVPNNDRLMRIAGTVNAKTGVERKLSVIVSDDGPRYTLDSLFALAPEPEELEDGTLVDTLTGEIVRGPRPAPRVRRFGGARGGSYDGSEAAWDHYDREVWESGAFRDMLRADGWEENGFHGGTLHLTRPGKQGSRETSATLGANDGIGALSNGAKFFNFSDNAPRGLDQGKGFRTFLSPYWYLVHTRYAGDASACAKELYAKGYGARWVPEDVPFDAASYDMWEVESQDADGHVLPVPAGAAQDVARRDPDVPVGVPKEPIPLEAPYPDPYDTRCFGRLGEAAEALAASTETPTDMALMALLGCVSASAGGRISVWVRPGHIEYATHYGITKAPPGKRKGAAQKWGRRPLEKWAAKRVERDRIAVMQDASRRRVAEGYLKTAEAKAAKSGNLGDLAEVEAANERLSALGEPLADCVLFTENTTPEALGDLMYQQGQRMAVIAAESTFLSVIGGRYSKGQPNIDLALKGFSQEAEEGARIGRKMPALTRPSLTIALAVQDDAISHLGKASVMMDERGLWGRVHWCVPRDLPGIRQYDVPEVPLQLADDYDRRLTALLDKAYDRDDLFEMRLSEGAIRAYRVFYSQTDAKLFDPIDRVPFYGWHDKAAGLVVRLAALITLYEHALDDELPREVPEDIFRAVASQMPVMMAHARKAASMMSLNEEDPREPARKVLQWISTRAQSRCIKVRDTLRALSSSRFPRLEPLMDALAVLEDNGWISFATTGDGSPDRATFWAHPSATPHLTDEASREALVRAPLDDEEVEERVNARHAAVTALAQELDAFVRAACETGGEKTHRVPKEELWGAWEKFSSKAADSQYFTEALKKVCPQVTEKRIGRAKVQTYLGIMLT